MLIFNFNLDDFIRNVNGALETIDKAIPALKINYGNHHENVQQLEKMKIFLQSKKN